jgi:integrase
MTTIQTGRPPRRSRSSFSMPGNGNATAVWRGEPLMLRLRRAARRSSTRLVLPMPCERAADTLGAMTALILLDAAGRRRSPATVPGHHCGRAPHNKGLQYPADPPTVEEVVAVMRCAGPMPHGLRARALIVLLWRAGLRISEALALAESDLNRATGGVLVRHGKGGKRREVGIDRWG